MSRVSKHEDKKNNIDGGGVRVRKEIAFFNFHWTTNNQSESSNVVMHFILRFSALSGMRIKF